VLPLGEIAAALALAEHAARDEEHRDEDGRPEGIKFWRTRSKS